MYFLYLHLFLKIRNVNIDAVLYFSFLHDVIYVGSYQIRKQKLNSVQCHSFA